MTQSTRGHAASAAAALSARSHPSHPSHPSRQSKQGRGRIGPGGRDGRWSPRRGLAGRARVGMGTSVWGGVCVCVGVNEEGGGVRVGGRRGVAGRAGAPVDGFEGAVQLRAAVALARAGRLLDAAGDAAGSSGGGGGVRPHARAGGRGVKAGPEGRLRLVGSVYQESATSWGKARRALRRACGSRHFEVSGATERRACGSRHGHPSQTPGSRIRHLFLSGAASRIQHLFLSGAALRWACWGKGRRQEAVQARQGAVRASCHSRAAAHAPPPSGHLPAPAPPVTHTAALPHVPPPPHHHHHTHKAPPMRL